MTNDQRTITNPAALHDPTPFGYSHAVSAPGETVFIGGQYASDTTGAPVPGDFATQVNLAFDRLFSALEGSALGTSMWSASVPSSSTTTSTSWRSSARRYTPVLATGCRPRH